MYIFYVDDGVNSGNRRLCQGSTETSLDLLEQHFHASPSDCEYIFGRVGVLRLRIHRKRIWLWTSTIEKLIKSERKGRRRGRRKGQANVWLRDRYGGSELRPELEWTQIPPVTPKSGAIIEVLPVPDDLKDRKAGFGYFIDDAFLGDYHGEKGKRYSRDSKISIVRNIAEMAECYPVILSSYSGAAVVPCFATHNARLIHQGPTAVEELDLFKQLFSIDRDPQWYEL
ncbi:hypothetical protein F5887DRAFT_1000294, partial [Amanita rubescens]